MIKNIVICVVALLIVVTASGCLEFGWASKGHVAFKNPKFNLFNKVVVDDSGLPSKEVVNSEPVSQITMVTLETPKKTVPVNTLNTNKNTQFASFNGGK